MNLHFENTAIHKIDASTHIELQTKKDKLPAKHHLPLAFSLDEQGLILECDKSVEALFGYLQHELVWQHISCLFPTLIDASLMQGNQLNPMLNYICHCDHHFEAIDKQSNIIVCNLNFVLVENEGRPNLRLIVRPVPFANHERRVGRTNGRKANRHGMQTHAEEFANRSAT